MKDLDTLHTEGQRILDRANEEYRRGLETGAVMSVFLLAVTARNMLSPDVTHVVLEWSDQGDFLSLQGAVNAAGEDVYEDHEDEEWEAYSEEAETSFAWNLGENCASSWQPFVNGSGSRRNQYLLDVDATIAQIGGTL